VEVVGAPPHFDRHTLLVEDAGPGDLAGGTAHLAQVRVPHRQAEKAHVDLGFEEAFVVQGQSLVDGPAQRFEPLDAGRRLGDPGTSARVGQLVCRDQDVVLAAEVVGQDTV